MTLSIVINTAPQREDNLYYCLQQLTKQTFQAFEVLVCDDGSDEGELVSQQFEKSLNLTYFWRPNDRCVNRSRNTGISHAVNEKLVLLDGDCLINSEALAIYDYLLDKNSSYIWSGYVGYIKQFVSQSALAANRLVNYLDRRFFVYSPDIFKPAPLIMKKPAFACWGGNLAFHKSLWDKLNGFDEGFVGWGNNDTEFALRAIENSFQIHFCIDSWAEHQLHSYGEPYHHLFQKVDSSGKTFKRKEHPIPDYQIMLYSSPQKLTELYQKIMQFYSQNDPGINPQIKSLLLKPQARLLLQEMGHDRWKIGGAIPSE